FKEQPAKLYNNTCVVGCYFFIRERRKILWVGCISFKSFFKSREKNVFLWGCCGFWGFAGWGWVYGA
ncbi:hypothetical protein ACVGWR_04315, partial [Enterobacter hormaechei]